MGRILPDTMQKQSNHISKPIYYLSVLTWLVNICFIALQFFFDMSGLWILAIFLSILAQGIVSGAFGDKTAVPTLSNKRQLIDHCLLITKYASITLASVGFVSLLLGGGRPEILNEAYYMISHGEIMREITENWFVFFCICEALVFTCSLLFFSTYMTLRIRALFVAQNATEDPITQE